ncbi:MAG: NADH-quinone oxidoreductase subunit K [Phycisphaerae bacterium]
MYYVGAVALLLVGFYMVLVKTNLIKIMLGISFLDTGTHVLLVAIGYVRGRTAPILSESLRQSVEAGFAKVVDPVPQALVLTAIVIGVGVLALGLSIIVQVYKHYGTLDSREIRGLKW